ncbi:MAG: hypothetical protein QT10_C0015G0004 [archaeon GW2011_AR19]|nr:MAG: hypothetical protein QT10_C0015G0004 [archaeon GW2011_AR19]
MKKLKCSFYEQKGEFLAHEKDELTLRYFIGDYDNYNLSSPEIHKKFNKVYKKNLVSEEDIYETQIPKIYSKYYNYKINGVKVQFYSKNQKLNRTIRPTTIRVQGLEKSIEKLVIEMKKEFHMETFI